VTFEIEDGPRRTDGLITVAWLYAGSNSAQCADCRAYYAREPDMLDFDAAEELALEALRRADSDNAPRLAVDVAKLIGRPERIRALLEELRSEAEEDQQIAIYERALREL
jgi:hypothetical protein